MLKSYEATIEGDRIKLLGEKPNFQIDHSRDYRNCRGNNSDRKTKTYNT